MNENCSIAGLAKKHFEGEVYRVPQLDALDCGGDVYQVKDVISATSVGVASPSEPADCAVNVIEQTCQNYTTREQLATPCRHILAGLAERKCLHHDTMLPGLLQPIYFFHSSHKAIAYGSALSDARSGAIGECSTSQCASATPAMNIERPLACQTASRSDSTSLLDSQSRQSSGAYEKPSSGFTASIQHGSDDISL